MKQISTEIINNNLPDFNINLVFETELQYKCKFCDSMESTSANIYDQHFCINEIALCVKFLYDNVSLKIRLNWEILKFARMFLTK